MRGEGEMSQALEVCGQVRQPGSFDFKALTCLPGQIEDIAPLVPGRTGGGVRLASLLDAVQPHPEATHLTVESTDGSFSASVPLAAVVESGVVLYRLGGERSQNSRAGHFDFSSPMRRLVPQVELISVPM